MSSRVRQDEPPGRSRQRLIANLNETPRPACRLNFRLTFLSFVYFGKRPQRQNTLAESTGISRRDLWYNMCVFWRVLGAGGRDKRAHGGCRLSAVFACVRRFISSLVRAVPALGEAVGMLRTRRADESPHGLGRLPAVDARVHLARLALKKSVLALREAGWMFRTGRGKQCARLPRLRAAVLAPNARGRAH